MFFIYFMFFISLFIAINDGRKLVKKGNKKEFWALIILLIIANFIIIGKFIINIGTPIDIIYNTIYPLGKNIFKPR